MMEPISETLEALGQLAAAADQDLLGQLRAAGEQVRRVVPECVGLSMTAFDQGITFTLVASEPEIAMFDALQYLDGGPCVEGADDGSRHAYNQGDVLDEEAWQLFSAATAARAVASTLTLPIRDDECVVGSVNLYAGVAGAFKGHHDDLANIFGAWAPGAVTNADLSFSTRAVAERAPQQLAHQALIHLAAGMLAARDNIGVMDAQRRIHEVAQRAGVPEVSVAGYVVDALGEMEDDDEGDGTGAR